MEANIDQKLSELKSICKKVDKGIDAVRIVFIIMRVLGVKEQIISNVFDVCDRTMDKWWIRYNQYGVDGLKDLPRSGCPKKLTDAQEKEIFEYVESSTKAENTEKIKTIEKIKEKISTDFNQNYSNSGIYNFLHRIGLSKIVPRPVHVKNDQNKVDEWLKDLPMKINDIKANKKDKNVSFYFEDETRYGQKTILTGIWALRGSSPTYKNQNGFLNSWIYGAVNPKTGDRYGCILPRLDAQNMQIFIDGFSKNLSKNEHAIIILDGSKAHKNHIIDMPNNISFIYLPPYSPKLNPIERLWNWIKSKYLSFKRYDNYDEIDTAGVDAWRLITEEIVKTVCSCDYLPV